MADEFRVFSWTILFLVFLFVNVATCQDALAPEAGDGKRRSLVPAMFIFRDSLIDNGNNNNNLPSFAKANYFPYGIDFDGGPTGRFSNGYTMVDELVGRIQSNQQIKNFENTLDEITDNLGAPDVAQVLAKCMFFVGVGNNDYLNNYLMPNYDTKNRYNGQHYANLLVQQYTQQLTRLYNLGAREFVIGGVGLMGCIPSILVQSNSNLCSEEVSQLVLPFSINVKSMLNNLNANLPVLNSPTLTLATCSKISSPVTDDMKQRTNNMSANSNTFPNRNQYIFWDDFPPTEAVNILFVRKAFNGGPDVVYPNNMQQLASL
ncbi:unnamed protein product [Withania somnifera]